MRTYTIKAGEHRAGWFFRPTFLADEMLISFRFHASCLYTHDLNGQLNKLIGLSGYALPFYQDGWHPGHHWQSSRLAWRPANNRAEIEVFRYDYREGQRSFRRIFRAEPGVTYQHKLITTGRPLLPGYVLYPYFGGKRAAPHDVHLEVGYELTSMGPAFWLPTFNIGGI